MLGSLPEATRRYALLLEGPWDGTPGYVASGTGKTEARVRVRFSEGVDTVYENGDRRKSGIIPRQFRHALWLVACIPLCAEAASAIYGQVLDLNGGHISHGMVVLEKAKGSSGPSAVTVFTDEAGHFTFPEGTSGELLTARTLGYDMLSQTAHQDSSGINYTLVMRADVNQAGVAPASAWLKSAGTADDRELATMICVGCHQFPSPEVRHYTSMMHVVPGVDPVTAAHDGWTLIVRYMLNIAGADFERVGITLPKDIQGGYAVGAVAPTTELLSRVVPSNLQEVSGYSYGAPLLATSKTVIREYEIPGPNAVREALTLEDPRMIWGADVSTNRLMRIDRETGDTRAFEIPSAVPLGPHTLVRDRPGLLWITSMRPGIISRFDPATQQFKVFNLALKDGRPPPALHDISFDADHNLMADAKGRMWFTDSLGNAVGSFDPRTGKTEDYPIPAVAGRVGNEQPYGLAMSTDGSRIWYAQLGIGTFGSFNTRTLQFEPPVRLPDKNCGPRRIAMSDKNVLYVALFGSGQLAEYDTKSRKLGIYDLPDRLSAPYAVTWDPIRKVVWVPSANADAIYRFDPRDKSFAVLPLPREGAFLRMVAVDKHSGELVTAYANIVQFARGPRMAVVIDPGDLSESVRSSLQSTPRSH